MRRGRTIVVVVMSVCVRERQRELGVKGERKWKKRGRIREGVHKG